MRRIHVVVAGGLLLLGAALINSCGPVSILTGASTAAKDRVGGGGGGTALTLSVAVIGEAKQCDRTRSFAVVTNKDADVTFSVNSGPAVAVDEQIATVPLRSGRNSIDFVARTSDEEQRQQVAVDVNHTGPSPPVIKSIEMSETIATVRWGGIVGISRWRILWGRNERNLDKAKEVTSRQTGVNREFILRLDPGTQYFFRIAALDDCGVPTASATYGAVTRPNRQTKWRGNGGTIATAQVPSSRIAPALYDFGDDGNTDLVVVRGKPDGNDFEILVDYYEGSGPGAFKAAQTSPQSDMERATGPPVAAVFVDHDRDLLRDVIVAAGSEVFTYLNSGPRSSGGQFNRAFQRAPLQVPGSAAIQDMKVGDFDGDGVPDIAVSTRGTRKFFVFFGIGEAGGSLVPEWLWHPARELAATTGSTDADGDFLVFDVDRDGLDDLVHGVSQTGGYAYRALLMQPGRAAPKVVTSSGVGKAALSSVEAAVLDVDQDGYLDLVTWGELKPGETALVARRNVAVGRDRGFDATPAVLVPALPEAYRAGRFALQALDVEGDGVVDLIVRTTEQGSQKTSALRVFPGRVDPRTQTVRWFTRGVVAAAWASNEVTDTPFGAGDISGNGTIDLVASHPAEKRIYIARSSTSMETGEPGLVLGGRTSFSQRPIAMQLGRLAGADAGDLLFGTTPGTLDYLPSAESSGLRSGGFGEARRVDLFGLLGLQHPIHSARLVRLDEDAWADIVCTVKDGQHDALYALRSTAAASANGPGYEVGAQIRPFTGDVHPGRFTTRLRPETVLRNDTAQTLDVMQQIGAGWTPRPQLPLPGKPQLVHVRDVNGDGFDDVAAIVDANGKQVLVTYMVFQKLGEKAAVTTVFERRPDAAADLPDGVSLVTLTSGALDEQAKVDDHRGLELIAGASDGSIWIFPNEPQFDNRFTFRQARLLDQAPIEAGRAPLLATLDWDQDGVTDIVAVPKGGTKVGVFVNKKDLSRGTPRGTGVFNLPVITELDPAVRPTSLTVGRLNDDSLDDLVLGTTGGLAFYLRRVTFGPPQ